MKRTTELMNRRNLLRSIGVGAIAVPASGCLGGLGGGGNGNNSTNSSSGESSRTGTKNQEGRDVFQSISYSADEFVIEFKSTKNVAGVNLVNEKGEPMGGSALATGASQLGIRHAETPHQDITFVAVNDQDEAIGRVTKTFAAELEFSDLRQPALDKENAGFPGENRASTGINPYTTLIVDVENTGNVPFTAAGISVTAGVPQPGSASSQGSAFTVQPGETKTVKADDSGNSTIAAWGGSWGAEGAPEGACQGQSKDAKILVISDSGRTITRKLKIVYRGGLYVMNSMQNFSTCGRIHSVGYRPTRSDLGTQTPEEAPIEQDR